MQTDLMLLMVIKEIKEKHLPLLESDLPFLMALRTRDIHLKDKTIDLNSLLCPSLRDISRDDKTIPIHNKVLLQALKQRLKSCDNPDQPIFLPQPTKLEG